MCVCVCKAYWQTGRLKQSNQVISECSHVARKEIGTHTLCLSLTHTHTHTHTHTMIISVSLIRFLKKEITCLCFCCFGDFVCFCCSGRNQELIFCVILQSVIKSSCCLHIELMCLWLQHGCNIKHDLQVKL